MVTGSDVIPVIGSPDPKKKPVPCLVVTNWSANCAPTPNIHKLQ